jgi:hypothetical protein
MKRFGLKREDLARALAQRGPLTEGQAQDELDRVVHRIVTNLRQGRPAKMPGVGALLARTPVVAKIPGGAGRMTSPKAAAPKTAVRKMAARKPHP